MTTPVSRYILTVRAASFLALGLAAAVAPAGVLAQAAPLPGRPAMQAPGTPSREARLGVIYAHEESLWARAARPGAEQDSALQDAFLELTRQYDRHLAAEPQDVEARLLYGKLLRRLGQADRAQEVFIEADRLNPNLAVVKQQIGNYLAERGDALGSVRMFLKAIELEPEVALYHHQLGELLDHFNEALLRSGEFNRELLDRQMLQAFESAVRLAPEQVTFRLRWAEAHFDVAQPDWAAALAAFEGAMVYARSELERQTLLLHRARCLKELGRPDDARTLAEAVNDPRLGHSKSQILRGL